MGDGGSSMRFPLVPWGSGVRGNSCAGTWLGSCGGDWTWAGAWLGSGDTDLGLMSWFVMVGDRVVLVGS